MCGTPLCEYYYEELTTVRYWNQIESTPQGSRESTHPSKLQFVRLRIDR